MSFKIFGREVTKDKRFLVYLIVFSFLLHIARTLIVFSTLGYGGVGWGNYPHNNIGDLGPVWDGGFYLDIAKNGYILPENIGFPPFYPLIIKIFSFIFPYDDSMLIINGVCLILAIPILAYIVSSELFNDNIKVRLSTIVITLNPFIAAWGTVGLSEPLGYAIGLALVYSYLKEKYLLSAILFSIGILTRYAFIVAGSIFLYDLLIKRKYYNLFPMLFGGLTYLVWNWYTKITYGFTNTEIRTLYWNHLIGIKFGDISMYAQLSNFIVVALLAILMLRCYQNKNHTISALLLWGVGGYLLTSIFPVYGYGQLRYVGFIIPIFLLLEGMDGWMPRAILYLSSVWGIVAIVVAPQIYQLFIGDLDGYKYLFMADIALILMVGAFIFQYFSKNSNGNSFKEKVIGVCFGLSGLLLSFTVVRIF